MSKRYGSTEDRFWRKVARGAPDECWVWIASKKARGYGQFVISDNQHVHAHRFAYELLKGPIPEGKQLDHLCRNTSCVNPDHLEPVTCAENVRRAPKTLLTMDEVVSIRAAVSTGTKQVHLARSYGVSEATISRIVRGSRWVAI